MKEKTRKTLNKLFKKFAFLGALFVPTASDAQTVYQCVPCPEGQSSVAGATRLSDCKNLGISSGKYEGIWTTIFVKPLAWLIVLIGNFFNNYGLSVIILTILIISFIHSFYQSFVLLLPEVHVFL